MRVFPECFLKLEDIAGYSIIIDDQCGAGIAHCTAHLEKLSEEQKL